MKICFLSIENQNLFEVPPYFFKITKIFLTNTLSWLKFIFPNQAELTKNLSTQVSILQVENILTRFLTKDVLVHAVNGNSFDLKKGGTSRYCPWKWFRNAVGRFCNGTDAIDAKSSQSAHARNYFWTFSSPDLSFNTGPLCRKYWHTTYRNRYRNNWCLKNFC